MAYNNRGWCAYFKGDYDSTISDTTRAIELDPTSGDAYGTRGWARYAKGDKSGALADCKKAVELEGAGTPDAAGDEGMLEFIQGDYQKAVTCWEAAIQNDPSIKNLIEPWIDKARAKLKTP
jgi:tetratricopeptide (TPR) repeat protein